jgi:dTDP-4-dehydrorhamnose reductase
MAQTVLVLGHTGKMGLALMKALAADYNLEGRNSRDFAAADFRESGAIIARLAPDIVINTVAFQGVDRCEAEPETAFRINALFPGHLARSCAERGIIFVHFSSDAVFSDTDRVFCTEESAPAPLNIYGITKYAGDCLVSSNCRQHYLCRIPLLFGESRGESQFVEKMLAQLGKHRAPLRVAADIVSSPSYSLDIAWRLRELLLGGAQYGTYHLANAGMASLHELLTEITANFMPGAVVEQASYRDFPFVGRKNLCTPLGSVRTAALRPWQEAVADYCKTLQREGGGHG